MVRQREDHFFLPVRVKKQRPMFRIGDPGRGWLADFSAERISLRGLPGTELSFRPAHSETQTHQHTGWAPTETVLFARMLIYSVHNRETLHILSRRAAKPES